MNYGQHNRNRLHRHVWTEWHSTIYSLAQPAIQPDTQSASQGLTLVEPSQVLAAHHILKVGSPVGRAQAGKLQHAGGLLLIQHATTLAGHNTVDKGGGARGRAVSQSSSASQPLCMRINTLRAHATKQSPHPSPYEDPPPGVVPPPHPTPPITHSHSSSGIHTLRPGLEETLRGGRLGNLRFTW